MRIVNSQSLPAVLDLMPEIEAAGRGTVSPAQQPYYRIQLWSFLVFNYRGRIRLADEEFAVSPGCAFLTSPGVPKHHFPAEASFHYYVHMRFPAAALPAPAYLFLELGDAYGPVCAALNELLVFCQFDALRARIRLWDLLQRLKDAGGVGQPAGAGPLRRAVECIEVNLDGGLDVAALARFAGVSPSYLVRLFRRHYGLTVSAYIRRRRIELARALLANTDLPIREIAAQAGIPDLQHFNKIVRRVCGESPRRLRAGARGGGPGVAGLPDPTDDRTRAPSRRRP